jgi:hypothetical protein
MVRKEIKNLKIGEFLVLKFAGKAKGRNSV